MIDLNKLNKEQREAVECTEGPLLVFAGAGSGKTRVLTYRLARMIEMGVPAWSILAITFTNKAAREMRERVDALCGEGAKDAWVMTFHSCCARILRRDIEKLGYKREFTIYDEDDKMSVIKRITAELGISDKNYPARSVRSVISDAKNRMLSPEEWLEENADARSKPYYKIYTEYEKRLKTNNALDFDDLLVKTLELLTEHPPVLESYLNKFRYILVDEYQDTNVAQYQLVRLLAGDRKNVCVVGDDDQSIYGWRGADIRNILSFENDFPGCRVVKLEENYRSTSNILNAANKVISNNSSRKAKSLWTESGEGDKIRVCRAMDERDEAAWVCDNISALIKQGLLPGDIAVLYRTNAQSRVIEEALVRRGIKYGVYGGLKFYDRKEIKDIVAYLKVLANPADDVSLRRIINEPRRGIGDSTIEALDEYASANGISMLNAVFEASNTGLGSRAVKSLEGFAELIGELCGCMLDMPMAEFTQTLLDKTGLLKQYENSQDVDDGVRVENIKEFISAISEYDKHNPDDGIVGFLENVALVTDTDRLEEHTQTVTLMTLHSAKGLEFGAVFLTGLEEGIFPISRAIMDDNQLEEERRLMYVGITRAKQKLFISYARSRMLFNNRQANPVSRFVSEIPRTLIDDGRRAAPPTRLAPSAPNQRMNAPKSTPGVALGIAGVSKGFGAQTEARAATLFKPGDKVNHRSFGLGEVVEVRPDGKIVVVDFGKFGLKALDANMSPMTLVK